MSSEVAVIEHKTAEVVSSETEAFTLSWRKAQALASSELVPKEYRDNPANALIAMNLADRIGADPLMVMQNLAIIHGRPSFSATFLIACVNMCGRFTPLQYKLTGEGMSRECFAYATDKGTGDIIEGPPVSMQMAKDEGWSTKNGSKWKTMPELMLRYRAAAFFARTTAPEIVMGMQTQEEIQDVHDSSRKVVAQESVESASLALTAAVETEVETTLGPEVDPETGEVIPDYID